MSLSSMLAASELLLLFTTILLGLALARVSLAGVRLGPAAILFVGIALSAQAAPMGELRIAHQLKELGLVLFVYCIGLSSGPSFFSTFRSRGLTMNAVALVALALGAGAALVAGRWLGLDAGHIAGLFSGALTNTPALGAATDALQDQKLGPSLAPHAALAYAVAYPFGVLGGVLSLRLFARAKRDALAVQRAQEAAARKSTLSSADFEVVNPAILGKSIGELRVRDELGVVISRMGTPTASSVPTKYSRLNQGDIVTAVGPEEALACAQTFFGARSSTQLEMRREQVDVRRILVSRRDLIGRLIGELDLERRYNAQVTRVRRSDLDLLPTTSTRLQLGDRLRVVAPVARMADLAAFFGDSERELANIDMLALALGLVAGLSLALLPLPLFGLTLSLGIAGGPLLVGLLLGWLGRLGRLVWALPQEASTTVRELGLQIFLAGVGVSAGAQLRSVALADGLRLFLAGAFVTLSTSMVGLWAFSRFARADVIQNLGACSGLQTQPATLAAAHEISGHSENTYVAYAVVYPVAMIAKILLAQLLARLG